MSNQSPTKTHDDTHSVSHGKITILAAILAATLVALIAIRGHSAHTENLYALVAARPIIAAMWTGADDITVGQEAFVVDGEDLFRGALNDQAVVLEDIGEVLREFAVGPVG